MRKFIVVLATLGAATALAQDDIALAPYVEALQASAAYLPGASQRSLHLANYDAASHAALARSVFSAGVLVGSLVPAARLHAGGSLLPSTSRWSEKHYLLGAEQRCEVFINVRDVEDSLAPGLPQHAAFAVWHELAHCSLHELLDAAGSADAGQTFAQQTTSGLAAVLPPDQGARAYALLNEAFADSFALLVQSAVHGNAAALDMARALITFRAEEQRRLGTTTDGHDTRLALAYALQTLGQYDLSTLTPRDRTVLAMNIAIEGTVSWAEREAQAGTAVRAHLGALERRLLTAVAAAPARAPAIAVYLAFPAPGTDRHRLGAGP